MYVHDQGEDGEDGETGSSSEANKSLHTHLLGAPHWWSTYTRIVIKFSSLNKVNI